MNRWYTSPMPIWFWLAVGCALGLVVMGTICWITG